MMFAILIFSSFSHQILNHNRRDFDESVTNLNLYGLKYNSNHILFKITKYLQEVPDISQEIHAGKYVFSLIQS